MFAGGFALQWSPTQPGLLLGADLKGGVQLWDLQGGGSSTSVQPVQDKFHLTRDCYTVAFDAHNNFRLASGGADGCVYLLDTRRLDRPLHVLAQHAGSVTQVAWSPCVPGLLASTGDDGFVLLVEAAAWNPDKPWVIASTSQAALAEDRAGHEVEVQSNLLMVWEVNRSVGLIW
eukprot:gene6055-6293_t